MSTETVIKNFLTTASKLLEDYRPEQTPIEFEFLVVKNASFGDPWAAYVQAMRELAGRYQGIHGLRMKLKGLQLDVDEACLDLGAALEVLRVDPQDRGSFAAKRQQLALKRARLALEAAEFALEQAQLQSESAMREAATVVRVAAEAREAVGELTEERRTELEWRAITARMSKKIGLSRMSGLPIGEEILKCWEHLPPRYQAKIGDVMRAPLPASNRPTSPLLDRAYEATASGSRPLVNETYVPSGKGDWNAVSPPRSSE